MTSAMAWRVLAMMFEALSVAGSSSISNAGGSSGLT